MVGVQVHRARTLARTELVGVGERVLEQLHDRDDARALVLDVLDRRAVLANVGEQQRNSAAALGQLQRRVDGAPDGLHVVLDAQQKAVVHDRATNRVRMRALDVEVVHLLRNFLRTHHFADSVHMAPMHNLVCLAGRPLSAYVVVQVLADIEDELFVRARQPRNEYLTRHVTSPIDVLANDGNDPQTAEDLLHLINQFRIHQVEHHPAGGAAPVPAEQPGQQSTLELFIGRQNIVGQPLRAISGSSHGKNQRRHDPAVAHHANRVVRNALMHGEVGCEHPLECCSQLLLVCELMCANREVNTVRCSVRLNLTASRRDLRIRTSPG